MLLKAGIVKVLLYRIAVVALACIVAGCGSKSAKLPTYMRPELLYLNHRPYSRLYVEVDTIEGVEVPDQWLDELKAFLETYCSKPDGIEIIRDAPVPISEVQGMPIGAASILCLDGPNPNSRSQPAYLHVFFYDRNVGLKAEKGPPHVLGFCPCGILFNVSYFRISKGKAEEFAMKHELGHVLGLCKNPEHGDGSHCENQGCLMYKSPGLLPTFGLLLGSRVEKQLCYDCQRDLETLKSEEVDLKLAFKGPFLIRREDDYSVASLPYCDVVIPTSVESVSDWTDLLSFLKDTTREEHKAALNKTQKSRERRWYIRGFWDGSVNKDASLEKMTEEVVALLRKAADDPCPPVKSYAKAVLKQFEKEQDK
jgi:hypothetical protein